MKRRGNLQTELTHEWAHQHGTYRKESALFYEGKSIYSWGHHYELARIVEGNVVLINSDRTYRGGKPSMSTETHKGMVRQAVSHMESYEVPSFTDHVKNFDYLVREIQDDLWAFTRARVDLEFKASLIGEKAGAAQRYASRFFVPIDEDDDTIITEACNLMTPDKMESYKQFQADQHERLMKRSEKKITDWINCKERSLPKTIKAIFLRTNCNRPDMVETSLGVNVSKAQAEVLYRRIMKGKDVRGFEIGGYKVDRYTAGVLHAGCHHIKIEEIKRYANSQGWAMPTLAQG